MEENPRQLIGLVVGGLFILPMVASGIVGAYFLGTTAGTDAFATQLPIARVVVAGVAVFITGIVALATIQEYGEIDEPEAVLTVIPYYEAVWGLLLLNFTTIVGLAVVPVVAVAVAFATGAGSPASVPVIVVVLLAVVAFAIVLGFVVGQTVRLLVTRIAFVARYKTVIGVVAFVAYFAVFATGVFEELLDPAVTVFETTPIGWFADLALVAAPDSTVRFARPAATAVVLLVGTPALTWLAMRLSATLWYSDAVQPEPRAADDRAATGSSNGTADGTNAWATGLSEWVFGGRVPRPTLRIAQKSWRRAYRAPMKLQYAAIPAFVLLTPIQQSVETGEVSSVLPALIAIYGAWATGAAFTLNPLGDEGAVLPITLTSGVTGRRLLGGLLFAGTAVGGPLTVLLVVGLGLASPLGGLSLLSTAVLAGVLCAGACAIGVGVGTAFPKFEKTRLSRSRRAIVPGILAFAVYSLVLSIVSLPGLLGGVPVVAGWIAGWLDVSGQLVTLAGLGITTALVGVAAVGSFALAARSIDGYTPRR